MCEAHRNNTIRRAFPVRKVSSSHAKGETVFPVENEISEDELRKAAADTGCKIGAMIKESYTKKRIRPPVREIRLFPSCDKEFRKIFSEPKVFRMWFRRSS